MLGALNGGKAEGLDFPRGSPEAHNNDRHRDVCQHPVYQKSGPSCGPPPQQMAPQPIRVD